MNTIATGFESPQALPCSACQDDDPCLPCGLAHAADEAGGESSRRRVLRGEPLFREGDPCRAILAVRSGTFKSVITGPDGDEQVTGFQIAGDILGLDGLADGRHASGAVALENSEVVVLPYSAEGRRDPHQLGPVLPRLIGRELVRKQKLALLLACMSAPQRLASFLLNLSRRLEARGYSAREFHLRMTRGEIGSYLGLNLETVSRTFSLLQQRRIVDVNGRHVRLRDRAALVRMFELSSEPPPGRGARPPPSAEVSGRRRPRAAAARLAH
jgi:CRP/FNR family transcriptional regulator, anaerobic regulatory protein